MRGRGVLRRGLGGRGRIEGFLWLPLLVLFLGVGF